MGAFLYHKSDNQTIVDDVETHLTFNTLVFDPDSVFASNVFTVPAGWDGYKGELFAGFRFSSTSGDTYLAIQKSVDGGYTWSEITRTQATGGLWVQAMSVMSGVISFTENDQYRTVIHTVPSNKNIAGGNSANFFGGFRIPFSPTNREFVRLDKTSDQAVASGGFVQINFDAADFDTASMFSSNRLIVPGGFPDSYGVIIAGVATNTDQRGGLYLQQSKDGGSSWGAAGESNAQLIVDDHLHRVVAVPVFVEAGDQFRAMFFASGSTRTLLAAERDTFMALDAWVGN